MMQTEEIKCARRVFIKKLAVGVSSFFGISSAVLFSQNVYAKIGNFLGYRAWESPEKTRIVANFSEKVRYNSFILQKPLRVVYDIENAKLVKNFNPNLKNDPRVREIRSGIFNNQFRIVLELKKNVHIKSFLLNPQGKYTYRLVVDLYDENPNQENLTSQNSPTNQTVQNLNIKDSYKVLIDPGHGGDDPGAIGRRYKTFEKDMVLDISKKLANKINRHSKMKAYLTRSSDYYISLRERINKARKYDVDLFISIHADSAHNTRAKGSSVYVLSTKGASGEFERLLAKRENAADFVGGVESAGEDLNDLLLSVVQNDTIDKSTKLASSIISELSNLRKPHSKTVKNAGFVVLKSPHIPSVLVETAFLSNSSDEKFLRQNSNREKIAQKIYLGVQNYLKV